MITYKYPQDKIKEVQSTIIAFGGLAYSGKSTAATITQQIIPTATRRAFAERVKDIARDVFAWDGEKDDRGRRLLQVIGTEAGRAYDPDIWIKIMAYDCAVFNTRSGVSTQRLIIIIDDARFTNEVEWVNKHGFSIRLLRDGAGIKGVNANHASEREIDKCPWTYTIDNNSTEGALYDAIKQILIERNLINGA